MSRETVGDEVRSGDLTVEGTVKTPAVNHPDATSGGLAVDSSGDVSVTGSVQVAESIVTNRARIVLSAPDDGTRYRHLLGANLDVDASGTYTKLATNISGAGWVFDSANGVGLHGVLSYVSAADDNTSTATPVERMRIDSSGRVGIGTSSPANALHVLTSSNTPVRVASSTRYASVFITDDTGGLFVQNDGGDLRLLVGGDTAGAGVAERMRINNAGLITGSGTSLGAWTAYTPTLGGTGWAIGNGTATGYYCQIGKVVHFRFDITFGSTSTFGASAALRVSTPVTARNALLFQQIPVVIAYDVSAGKFYQMSAMVASTTGIDLYAYNGGANGEISELRSTNPFTWASGDIIRLQGSVEAA